MIVELDKSYFGYVAQHFVQYGELIAWENIKFYANLYNVDGKKKLLALLARCFMIKGFIS